MTIEYKTVGATEKNKMLVDLIKANEADHMSHTVNLERYRAIAQTAPDGDLKNKVLAEIPVLEQRILEVENILQNTYSQITDAEIQEVLTDSTQA